MIYIQLLLLLLSVRLLRGHEATELHLSVFCKQLLPECIIFDQNTNVRLSY